MKQAILVAVMVLAATAGAARVDELATARDLYASAAYEEALAALNRARAAGVAPADTFTVEQYRAFCLLALGRGSEAQSAIENVVLADPSYSPSADVSPRVRSAFSEVRRRVLPSIVPQQYAKAKAAFDRKDYATAAAGFTQVLNLLADPDAAQAAAQPPLSDLRTLATGFQELSAKTAAPPAPPPAPEPAAAPAVLAPPRVYTAADAVVTLPTAIRQELPGFPTRLGGAATGALEIVINEQGFVESATMRESVNSAYDRQVLDATRSWRYKPATIDGAPVKFRKMIQISVKQPL